MTWGIIALGHQADVNLDASATEMKQNWPIKVKNMVFDGTKGWQRRLQDSHPMLALSVRTNALDYEQLNPPDPKLKPKKHILCLIMEPNLA